MSTYVGTENVDIETGEFYSPNMTIPPFSMPEPKELFFDGYHYHELIGMRDPSKYLGLWELPLS